MADRPPGATAGSRRIGGTLVIATIVLGLVAWRLAFNAGAYDVVFYEDVYSVVVASSILAVATATNRPFSGRWNVLACSALAGPLVWLGAAVAVEGSTGMALERPVFAVALAIVIVVSIPLTLRLLVELFHPELTTTATRGLTLVALAVLAAVALAGFLVGRGNDRFMTCSDFEIAGSARPDNCAEE